MSTRKLMSDARRERHHVDVVDVSNDGRYAHITFSKPDGFVVEKPGQYCIVACEDIATHCVLAQVHRDTFTITINAGRRLHEQLTTHLRAEVSDPMGGFSVDDVRGRNVLCFAGGSGIAAIASLIADSSLNDASSVVVYYAERYGGFAYRDLLSTRATTNYVMTEGVLSANPHIPILGMLAKLAGNAPVMLPKPVVYVAGKDEFVKRLRRAFVPAVIDERDFRTNF